MSEEKRDGSSRLVPKDKAQITSTSRIRSVIPPRTKPQDEEVEEITNLEELEVSEVSDVFELSDSQVVMLDETREILGPDRSVWTALKDSYLEELRYLATKEPRKAGRLFFEVGRLEEEVFKDNNSSIQRFRKAAELDQSLRVNLRALRRRNIATGSWSEVVKLLNMEIKYCPDETNRATLLEECGRIQTERLSDNKAAGESLKKALSLDNAHQTTLFTIAELSHRTQDWRKRAEILVQMANSTRDPDYKASLMAESAFIREHALKDGVRALEMLALASKANPHHHGSQMAQERLLFQGQRWGELVDLLVQEADLTANPLLSFSNRYLAGMLVWNRLGHTDRAIELMEQAATIHPDSVLPLLELAELYQETGRWEELAGTIERILNTIHKTATHRQIASLLFRIGAIYQVRLQNVEQAKVWFRQAMEVAPTDIPARRGLAVELKREQRWDELAQLLQLETEIEEDNRRRASSVLQLAVLHEEKLGDPRKAIELYELAHSLHQGRGHAFRALDRLYTVREEWERLADLYQREAELTGDAGRRTALLKRAAQIMEERLHKPDDAMRLLRSVLVAATDDRQVLMSLGRLYERLDRYEDLAANLEKEAAISKDAVEVCAILTQAAEIYEDRLEDQVKAKALYERVLEVDPGHPEALSLLGRLHYRQGKWDELVKVYKREVAVSANPSHSADLLYRVGQLLETKLADNVGAVDAYREALAKDPNHVPSQDALEDLLRRVGRWEDLLLLLQSQAKPEDPDRVAIARLRAGLIMQDRLGDLEGSVSLLQQAQGSESTAAISTLALERLYSVKGDWNKLVELLSKGASDISTGDTLRAGLRLVYVLRHHKQDPPRARGWCKRIIEQEGPNVEVLVSQMEINRKGVPPEQLGESMEDLALRLSDPSSSVSILKQKATWTGRQIGEENAEAQIAQSILQYHPADREALETLERMALEKGDDGKLSEVCRHEVNHVVYQPEEAAVAYHRLGDVLWRLGRPGEAALAYGRALEFDKRDLPALRSLRVLLQLQGDQQQVAERLLEEADLCSDEKAATTALMKAGDIWLIEFLDPARAEQAYATVFEKDPNHEVAFQRLCSLVASREGYPELAVLFKRRLAKCKPEQRLQLLKELGVLYHENLKDLTSAISTYEQMLALDAKSEIALEALSDLYGEQRRWRESAETLEKLVQAASEQRRTEVRLKLAKVLHERLHEDERARKLLNEILAKEPEMKEALDLSVTLDLKLGNWDQAAQLLQKLADTAQPVERAKHLITLAEVCQRGLNQPDKAQEHLVRAAALCLLAPQAISELERFFYKQNDPKGYESLLARVLKEAGADRPGSTALRLSRAKNLAQHLLKPEEAERQVQMTLEQDPESVDARLELASLHLWGENVGLALVEYQAALERNPVRFEAYRGLMQVFERRGELDRARCAAQVLCVLGQATEREEEEAESAARAIEQAPIMSALTPDLIARFMAPREEVAAARDLLRVLSPFLSSLFPPDLESKGIRGVEELPIGHNAIKVINIVAARLGMTDLRVLVDRRNTEITLAIPGPQPILLLGSKILAESTSRVLSFYAARELAGISTGSAYLKWADLRELELTLAGLVAQFDRDYGEDIAPLSQLLDRGRNVLKIVPRKVKKTLEEPALLYSHAGSIGMSSWKEASLRTGVRVGLCCAGHLRAAVEALHREQSSEAEITSLCLYSVSARYAEARKVFGVGF